MHCCNILRLLNSLSDTHHLLTGLGYHLVSLLFRWQSFLNVNFLPLTLSTLPTVVTSCLDDVCIVKLSNRSLVIRKQQMTLLFTVDDWPIIRQHCHLVTKYCIRRLILIEIRSGQLTFLCELYTILQQIYNIFFKFTFFQDGSSSMKIVYICKYRNKVVDLHK